MYPHFFSLTRQSLFPKQPFLTYLLFSNYSKDRDPANDARLMLNLLKTMRESTNTRYEWIRDTVNKVEQLNDNLRDHFSSREHDDQEIKNECEEIDVLLKKIKESMNKQDALLKQWDAPKQEKQNEQHEETPSSTFSPSKGP